MASSARVLNLTTQRHLKRGQAEALVADGVCVWVVEGQSVRALTREERVAARSAIARVEEAHGIHQTSRL